MKRSNLIIITTLLLAASFSAQTPAEKISKFEKPKDYSCIYNKFQDVTDVWARNGDLKRNKGKSFSVNNMDLNAAFSFKGEILAVDAQEFNVMFTSSSKNWHFLEYRSGVLLIDGERIVLGEGVRSSDVYLGSVTETISFTFTRSILIKIANAKQAEIQIGLFESQFGPKEIKQLKNLLFLGTK